ncbi:lantibiotic dehydratase [Pedobacter helvus]|uniref:Thiopeptide-type bacteriocin biosynthesis protein n=1 Tax=Pedobacter helvus TaxID=2563444 RepID=A0ABW9JCL4_9SPHI|nr:lantibiotic dehydratase [Pedobacter ureilyticus]
MKPHHSLILRLPQFPMKTKLTDVWNELKSSIRNASPEFYDLIKETAANDIPNLPERTQITIFKYFNRAKFRCTPFGTFSSFGVVMCMPASEPLIVSDEKTAHALTDWPNFDQSPYSFEDLIDKNSRLFANSSYYKIGNAIRYIKRKDETFELAEVDYDPMIVAVLNLCRKPVTISELLKTASTKTKRRARYELLEDMIICGLLITELDPNIIGEDYFKRINLNLNISEQKYLLSEQKIIQGNFPQKLLQHIPQLLELLKNTLPLTPDSDDLIDFTKKFTKHFDRANIPLMTALDPELGIGYGNLHLSKNTGSLVGEIIAKSQAEKSDRLKELKAILNDHCSFKVGECIRIDDLLKSKNSSANDKPLPNSCSMMIRAVDENIIVERIGGNTFNQLAGRFSFVSSDVKHLCSSITEIEEQANQNVVFFDLAYHAEKKVDNVNRRSRIYQQELNLLNYSELDEPLTLDDLYISVSGDKIVLRSKRLGKRVIPRMASAYNYQRSELPVFRFLYDLSYHGIWSDLTFDPLLIFPKKKYYPRFQFRNIILSPAKLKIINADIQEKNTAQQLEKIKELLCLYQLGDYVRLVRGDEYLVFNINFSEELQLLLQEIKKNGEVYVEEFLMPDNPTAMDKNGAAFNNQFVVPLVHHKEIYFSSAAMEEDTENTQRKFLPGNRWLSFEIYSHTGRADEILLGPLTEILLKFRDYILCWFFIRYNENGDHLRFRIEVNDDQFNEPIFKAIRISLQPFLNAGLISDLTIKTYIREIERYDIAKIDYVEQHFKKDSEFVVKRLQEKISERQKYVHCLQLFLGIKSSGLIKTSRYDSWINNIAEHFGKEFQMDKTKYKNINSYYKETKFENLVRERSHFNEFQDFLDSFILTLSKCPEQRRAPLFTDLMHMHINRLFDSHQRVHEMIIYNLLSAIIKTATSLANKASQNF